MSRQRLDPARTTWHITWGTYGARLHGGDRPTVERPRNTPGEPFARRDERHEQHRKNLTRATAVYLSDEQRCFVESVMPGICERGGWTYRICAAGPERDHVHVLCDIEPAVHGKNARRWMKRWLTEALNVQWQRPEGGCWWAEGGSAIAVKDEAYLNTVFSYLMAQRASTQQRAGVCHPGGRGKSQSAVGAE